MRLTVTDKDGRDLLPYIEMLNGLGDAEIARIDREEAGRGEGESYTFAGLSRPEQAQILAAIDRNIVRNKAVNYKLGPTSYGLKHGIEKEIGTYTSNLQAKTAMRILGFKRSGDPLNPKYNIAGGAYDRWRDAVRANGYRGRDGEGIPVDVSLRIGEGALPVDEFARWYYGPESCDG